MADEWRVEPLERLVDPGRAISYGIVQPGAATSDGIPIVRVTDIRDGRIATTEPLRVSRDIEAAYARTRLRGGELLLTLVGTVGEAAIAPDSLAGWNTARAVAVIPIRPDVGSYWVKLALHSPEVRHVIDSRLNTTVQATLNLRDVAQLPIVLPPESARRAIAHILGTLDDKIELNRRLNETLEAMARALFNAWFVDFDPVRAKSEGRDHGLPKPIADLFPDRLVDSELGEIPEGWGVGTLGMLGQLAIGGDWGEDEAFAGSVEAKCLRGVDLEHLRRDGHASPPRRWFKRRSLEQRAMDDTDVLIAGSGAGPTGRPLWMCRSLLQSLGPSVYSNFCKRIRCGSAAKAAYLDAWLHIMRVSGEIWEHVNGTSVPNLDTNSLLTGKEVPIPTMPILHKYHDFVRPLWQSKFVGENHSLIRLRDALLPKLVSGELRVADFEQSVGRTT